MKIKVNKMGLVTPLGKVVLTNKPTEESLISLEDFEAMMDEWANILTTMEWFKIPSQDKKVYLFPKEVLRKSYVVCDVEEINES